MNHNATPCCDPRENICAVVEVSADILFWHSEKKTRGEGNTLFPFMLSKQKPTLEATIYDKYTHANSALAFVLRFFTTYVAKQNGTTCSVLGEIK